MDLNIKSPGAARVWSGTMRRIFALITATGNAWCDELRGLRFRDFAATAPICKVVFCTEGKKSSGEAG